MSGLAEGLSEAYRCNVVCGALAGVCARREHAHKEMVAGVNARHVQRAKKWWQESALGISWCEGGGSKQITGQRPKKHIAPVRETTCRYVILSKTKQPGATRTYSTPHMQVICVILQVADCAIT